MSSIGFPIVVVGVLLAGTAAAIVITPRDLLRSTVVTAPSPFIADGVVTGTVPQPAAALAVPVVRVASMTVEVTPLSEPAAYAAPPAPPPAALVAATPAEEPAAEDLRTITAGALNMRAEPNKSAQLISSLPRGTVVAVSRTSGSWAYVTAPDGSSGWLSQNFLSAAQ
jgi:uncharacterized protein YgiM (DUF1202 family)